MLLFICLALLVMAAACLAWERSRVSFLFAGLLCGLAVVLWAYVLIWTKYGGARESAAFMLYLTSALGRWLLYLPLSAPQLSQLLVGGKTAFLLCLMLLTLCLRQPERPRMRALSMALIVAASAAHALLLSPALYDRYSQTPFFQTYQVSIFHLIRAVYVLCLVICLTLQAVQYRRIHISWARRSFYHMLLLNVFLSFLFVLFAVFAPIQVSSFTGVAYIYANYLYIQSPSMWIWIAALSWVLIISGSRCLWQYARIARNISQPDVSIDQKMRGSNAGVRMLIHGMKNQLLVQRAMLRDLSLKPCADPDIRERLEAISASNAYMLERIDKLYRIFKRKAITLVEIPAPVLVVEDALQSLRKTQVPVRISCLETKPILGDPAYLSEAFANVIINGVEAIEAKESIGPEDHVQINIYLDRKDLVFEFVDTGEGMSRGEIRRIYDPFYSSRNSNTNWGVGLTYAQEIVRAHFGKTSIMSAKGQGASVYISIPVYEKNGA